MRKLFTLILALVASIGMLKAEVITGTCGTNLNWSLDFQTKTLTIEGKGYMQNMGALGSAPWYAYRDDIETVILPGDLTRIGSSSFYGCYYLRTINLPQTLKEIGSLAFAECYSLESITFPDSLTTIGNAAFERCTSLLSINIPNTVTTIGSEAFMQCSSLKSVVLPESLTQLNWNVFSWCTSLTNIVIPISVTSIDMSAFNYVANIEYHGSLPRAPFGARSMNGYVENEMVYADNSKTTLLACPSAAVGTVTIPSSVHTIGDNAFFYCSQLQSIQLPSGLENIGESAFEMDSSLLSLTIPQTVTTIGPRAFVWCKKLTSLVIPNSVTSLGDDLFGACMSLTEITLPVGLKVIGDYFFNGCPIQTIVLPDSVTTIGQYAFGWCDSLKNVTLPATVSTIGSYAFSGCSQLCTITCLSSTPPSLSTSEEVFNGVEKYTCSLYVPEASIELYRNAPQWSEFMNILPIKEPCKPYEVHVRDTVMEGVTLIGYSGADYPYYLIASGDEMYYNDTLRTVDGCDSIIFHQVTVIPIPRFSITLSANNSEYGSVEGAGTYIQDTTITIAATPNEGYQFNEWSDGSIANPRTIKVTGDSSFTAIFAPQECVIASGKCGTDLTWTLTCDSMFIIRGTGAMNNYSAYNSTPWYTHRTKVCKLRLSEHMTTIGQHAFQYCAIDTLIIPESVTNIGYQAFNNCTRLRYIHFPKTHITFGESVFSVCNSLQEITIPDYFTTIPKSMFSYCAGLKNINFPEGLKSIGSWTFNSCTSLQTLNIPSGVTSIGEYAFQGCYALIFIHLGEQFRSLGSNSFQSCSKLKSIEMQNPTPPSTGSSSGINPANCRLFVPAESVEAYKNANWWKTFFDVVPIGSDLIVTFLDWDNTVLYVDTVPRGGTAEAPIPTKDGYTFTNWSADLTNVQYDFSVTAQFETNRYLVQFVDWDGTVLKSDSVYYQGWVEAPENPYRKGYSFIGWDKEFTWEYLTGDMIITAQYMELQPGDAHVREDGGIHALFSVSDSTQVLFSRGNLQFNAAQGTHACADGTTQPGTWRFAPEQYDVRTWENYNRGAEYDNWIDLFAFGATGYNGNTPTLDEETVSRELDGERSYYDFGVYNAISNGANQPGEWRMFTQTEWRYLVQQRPHANKLCAHAKINDIYGVIILPDNGDTTLIYKEIDYNDPEAYYNYDPSVPVYSLAEWRQLEAKGAIFFPAGGLGSKSNGYFNVNVLENGYYLVYFTPKSNYTSLLAIGFDTTTIWSGLTTPRECISVRLVKDAPISHLNAVPNNSTYGSVSGDFIYFGEDITITATPNTGYHFVQWSDGITTNPRTFTLTGDSTIIAEFAPNTYTLNVSCEAEQGTIEGESGNFDYLSEHTLKAVANYGYTFAQWSDGVTDNPRTLLLTQDTTITAIYNINYYPVVFLNWNGQLLSEQSIAYNHAAEAPELPAREGFIFTGWTADIEHITDQTFAIALYDKEGVLVTYKDEDGETIFSEHADLHLPDAPSLEGKTFAGWLTEIADNTNGIVLRATYTTDKPSADDDVVVNPGSTSADVNFPYVTGAVSYILVIRNLYGKVVCKILFNATGQLLGIAFAPERNNRQNAQQTAGFSFTVEGLDPNTTYEYEFVAHDETDEIIETLTGSFTTTEEVPTGVQAPMNDDLSTRKIIRDDQVFIIRGDKTYTVTGQETR